MMVFTLEKNIEEDVSMQPKDEHNLDKMAQHVQIVSLSTFTIKWTSIQYKS